MDSDGGLRDRRLKKNISLRTAAREVGISAQYLSEIERGRKNPLSAKIVVDLAQLYDLDSQELFNYFCGQRYRISRTKYREEVRKCLNQ